MSASEVVYRAEQAVEQTDRAYDEHKTLHSCAVLLQRHQREGRVLSNDHAVDGDEWMCDCGRPFVHMCDEAEGCCWVQIRARADRAAVHLYPEKRAALVRFAYCPRCSEGTCKGHLLRVWSAAA